MSKSKETLGVLIFGLCVAPLLALWHAWILTKLWSWFIVPAFHFQALAMSTAIGLSLIAAMFIPRIVARDDDEEEYPTIKFLVENFFKSLLVLSVGACWHACL